MRFENGFIVMKEETFEAWQNMMIEIFESPEENDNIEALRTACCIIDDLLAFED
jgi:hypothetical protein